MSFQKNLTPDIPLYLFTFCLSWSGVFKVLGRCLKALVLSKEYIDHHARFADIKKSKADALIWESFMEENDSSIVVITTLSAWNSLPVCFSNQFSNRTKRIMLWYSNNSFTISRKNQNAHALNPLSAMSRQIDLNLIWSASQRELIELLGLGQARVVGPIHFQRKVHPISPNSDSSVLRVLFFDIRPVIQLEKSEYFTSESAIGNLDRSLKCMSKIAKLLDKELEFVLKPKRRFIKGYHSLEYEKFVKNSVRTGEIKLISNEVNLYDSFNETDLVLGVPYTSPVQLAHFQGISSVYVAMNSQDWSIRDELDGIPIARTPDELHDMVFQALKLNKM